MSVRFFLGTQEVRVEVSPSLTRKKDETFDGAKVTLEFNDNPTPVPAGTLFRVVEDIASTYAYAVASDVAETASQNPLRYKHALTLVEPVSLYKQRIPRNLIFTQPADMEAKGSVSKLFWVNYLPGSGNPGDTGGYWGAGWSSPFARPMAADTRTKLANLMGKCVIRKTFVTNGSDPDPDNWKLDCLELNYSQAPCDLRTATVRLTYGDGFHRDYTLNQVMPTAGEWALLPQTAVSDFNAHGGPITADVIKDIRGISAQGSDELGYYVTVSIELSATAYYFTLLDVVRGIFDAAAQKRGYSQEAKYPEYAMPQLDADLESALENTIAPNLTFTQSTLYESLAEVFRYLDGRPCTIASHDESQGEITAFHEYLGIKYFSDLKHDMTDAVLGDDGILRMAGKVSSSSIERRADGIKSYYQNALQRVCFPDNRHMGRVRSVTLAVPGEGDFALVVPEPIEKVTKVEMEIKPKIRLASGSLGDFPGVFWLNSPVKVDMTDFFFEQSIWSDLPQVGNVDYNGAQSDYTEILQNICLPYSKGSKSIDLTKRYDYLGVSYQRLNFMRHAAIHKWLGQGRKDGWTFGSYGNFTSIDLNYENLPAELDWADYRIRIEYIAKTEGVAEVESPSHKMAGDLLSNQAGGGVDLGKMGANMLGLAMKGGEPKMTATIEIRNLANRIEEGDYIKAEDGVYVAGSISYVMLSNGRIQETVEFTKNFNSLSPFIRVDEEKRLSNIDYSIAERCEDVYIDYIRFLGFTTDMPNTSAISSPYAKEWIEAAFPCNDPTDRTADLAYIDNRREGDAVVVPSGRIALPLRVYPCGNAVCMEASFDDPMSAGASLEHIVLSNVSAYYSKAIKYAGDYGFFDKIDFHVARATGEIYDANYPKLNAAVGSGITEVVRVDRLTYNKKPNEIFGVNYEICIVPAEGKESEVFVGRRFVSQFGPLSASRKTKEAMRLYHSDEESYSILDEDGLGDFVSIGSITAFENPDDPNIVDVIITAPIANIAWKSFAICDSEGKIYLACNQPRAAIPSNSWRVSFACANRRL